MATYQVSGPNGQTYKIEGPDDADPSAIIQQITGHQTPQTTAAQNPAKDFGGSTLQFGPWNTHIPIGQGTQNFLAGAGEGLTNLVRGAGQLTGMESRQDVATARAKDAPLNATGAGRAGNITGTVAGSLPAAFIPGANTVAGGAAIGAGMGLLQPSTSTAETLLNTGAGGALGAAVPWAGGKIGSAVRNLLQRSAPSATAAADAGVSAGDARAESTLTATPTASATGGGADFGSVGGDASAGLTSAQQRAMAAGKALGMRSTPGQASGSRSLQQLEAKLESQPMTSGPFNAIKDVNQKVLNRVSAAAIGEASDVVDSATMERASDRLGSVFQSVRSPNKIAIVDPDVTKGVLDGIDSDYEGLLPNNASIRANPLVSQLETLTQKGGANGEQLGSLSSKLGRAAYKQMSGPSGDRDLGQALYAVKDHVDDMVESSLSGSEQQTYQAARAQYRNLMLLTGRQGIVNPSSGNIAGGALANRLQQADKSGFLFGKNQSDWYNAARFAQAFKPIVGDSGTATRSMITKPMDFLLSLPTNLATRAYLKTPAAFSSAVANSVANPASGLMRAGSAQVPRYLLPAAAGGLFGSVNSSK